MLNHKKVLSLALASAMSLSMMAPAFAAETASTSESTSNRQLKVDGTYQTVDIAVVVPTTGTVVINPYALPYEIGKDANNKAIKAEGQQIVTKPMTIKNQSETALYVNVSATTTTKGSLTLAAAPISDTAGDTKNEAFVYLDLESSTLTGATSAITDAAIASAYNTTTWTDYVVQTDDTNTPANVLALKTSAVSKEKMITLAAAGMNTSTGAFDTYNSGSIAFVGLKGQCAENPKTAWTTKDGLTATIAFTFTPNTTTGTGSDQQQDNSQQDNSQQDNSQQDNSQQNGADGT
jgi:hypothetical protein